MAVMGPAFLGAVLAAGVGPSRLAIEACPLEGVAARVECGTLEVLENRETGDGRRIPIRFVRVRSPAASPEPAPLVFLAGGPGAGGTGAAARSAARFAHDLERRDLLFLDQRGTGDSNRLDCSEIDLEAEPGRLVELFERPFFDPEIWRDCLPGLAARADLAQYTTTAAAHDLDELREALGYSHLNLEGGSYGTRLGLEYLRRHGDRVRSAVLRGVAPSSALLVETLARDFQDSLEALIRHCAEDATCSRRWPDFPDRLERLIDRVTREDVRIEVRHPTSGAKVPVILRREQLLTALRFSLYSTRLASRLPAQVAAAEAGDFEPLTGALGEILLQLKNQVAEGMWASVKCSEELPFIDLGRARGLARGTLMGTLRLDAERAICSFWPRGPIPDDFHEPVRASAPVLLIGGEYDPTSPMRLAETAAAALPNAALVRARNRSHWGLGGDSCIEGIVSAFRDAASVEGLDVTCAEAYTWPEFEGPEPAPSP